MLPDIYLHKNYSSNPLRRSSDMRYVNGFVNSDYDPEYDCKQRSAKLSRYYVKRLYGNPRRELCGESVKIPQIEINYRTAEPLKEKLHNCNSRSFTLNTSKEQIKIDNKQTGCEIGKKNLKESVPKRQCVQSLNFSEIFIRSSKMLKQGNNCPIPKSKILYSSRRRQVESGSKSIKEEALCIPEKSSSYHEYLAVNDFSKRVKRKKLIREQNRKSEVASYEHRIEDINLLLDISKHNALKPHVEKKLIKRQKEDLKECRLFDNDAIFDLSKAIHLKKNASELY
eukprot:TRINITY_DN8056_c0_g2_i5.p1 TRINITY_DN8056_c0_g2~~TRINITY_DN8056_c0_g2_i5.p1  ORF type:complete len:283 (-),score=39.16 TRINITY_DN8056_c0_g2_i5:92-940(-)